MKRLDVHFRGWGQDWVLGTLAEVNRSVYFEYSQEALDRGIEFSPHATPLRPNAHTGFPEFFDHLPGFIADALPDGWGLYLMDKAFTMIGRERHTISPLERLAFIGDSAMGALSFMPASGFDTTAQALDVLQMSRAARAEHEAYGTATQALGTLVAAGGSAQGARPKAFLQIDDATGMASTDPHAPGDPWLVKFPAAHEMPEVCALEEAYAQVARACGIEMPLTRLFDLPAPDAAFGVRRFDRDRGMRVPIISAAAALNTNFRAPQVGYQQLMQVTGVMCGPDATQMIKVFERCVFNVVFNNQDDHAKNFAFRMNETMRWELSPAFDLTFARGRGDEHHMDVAGHGRPGGDHLMRLATAAGISLIDAKTVISKTVEASVSLPQTLRNVGVSSKTAAAVLAAVNANAAHCSTFNATRSGARAGAGARRPPTRRGI